MANTALETVYTVTGKDTVDCASGDGVSSCAGAAAGVIPIGEIPHLAGLGAKGIDDAVQAAIKVDEVAGAGDGLVNLASPSRTKHILQGDATGGGHLWPGVPGKTPFPRSWSADKVMEAISEVATNLNSTFKPGRGGSLIAAGDVDGIVIRVITRNGEIITGYPTSLPRNS